MNRQQTTDDTTTVEFYLPSTFQFSTEPGRVERLLARVFHRRGTFQGGLPADETEYDFYVPGTTRGAFLRRGRRPEPR